MGWWVYILRCGDGTLYTGTAVDVNRRAAAHAGGRGAKYTRGRGPLVLAYQERVPDRSAALRREREIKDLSRAEKEALIAGQRQNRTPAGKGEENPVEEIAACPCQTVKFEI